MLERQRTGKGTRIFDGGSSIKKRDTSPLTRVSRLNHKCYKTYAFPTAKCQTRMRGYIGIGGWANMKILQSFPRSLKKGQVGTSPRPHALVHMLSVQLCRAAERGDRCRFLDVSFGEAVVHVQVALLSEAVERAHISLRRTPRALLVGVSVGLPGSPMYLLLWLCSGSGYVPLQRHAGGAASSGALPAHVGACWG